MQCSVLTLCGAVLVAILACGVCAQRGQPGPGQPDQVAKTLMDLDRYYSKRLQSDSMSDAQKTGEDLTKLKQAYKLLLLQDLDNKYKMINRPRYGKRSDARFLDLGSASVPAGALRDDVIPVENLLWARYAERR